jgi:hypothetical protein
MPEFKDKVGNELQPGDLIIYGHALGRCAGLRYGKVLYAKESKSAWSDKTKNNLRVQGVDDDWSHMKPELAKPGTLQFSTRILKVRRDQIPANVLALLDGVNVEST